MAKRFRRKLPDGFQADNLCSCMYATYLLTEYNVARGYVDFKVVKGELHFTDVSGRCHRDFHRWIKLSNSRRGITESCGWKCDEGGVSL
jgi:hypothetical protein